MYNSQYYTCEQIDERLLQGYLDDYNSQTGQSLTKAQFLTKLGSIFSKEGTIDNTLTQIGYYECDTAAGTAAKVITVANYSLFAGGSMKVKFVNKNTANNATLNINSQGAKALYYNGVRVSSTNTWDAGEVVEIYYDGTSYYANNVKGSTGDGVFDISVYNPTEGQPTPYADLATALGPNGQNVPVQYRKGGMSVKYVQSSDNKYVQYRLMSDTFNTTPANWQGVDDEPTAGSNNLVKSGGVSLSLNRGKIIFTVEQTGFKEIQCNFNAGDTVYIEAALSTSIKDIYLRPTYGSSTGQKYTSKLWLNDKFLVRVNVDIQSMYVYLASTGTYTIKRANIKDLNNEFLNKLIYTTESSGFNLIPCKFLKNDKIYIELGEGATVSDIYVRPDLFSSTGQTAVSKVQTESGYYFVATKDAEALYINFTAVGSITIRRCNITNTIEDGSVSESSLTESVKHTVLPKNSISFDSTGLKEFPFVFLKGDKIFVDYTNDLALSAIYQRPTYGSSVGQVYSQRVATENGCYFIAAVDIESLAFDVSHIGAAIIHRCKINDTLQDNSVGKNNLTPQLRNDVSAKFTYTADNSGFTEIPCSFLAGDKIFIEVPSGLILSDTYQRPTYGSSAGQKYTGLKATDNGYYFIATVDFQSLYIRFSAAGTITIKRNYIADYHPNIWFNKKCLYIGDSISTTNQYYWKGILETEFNFRYTRDLDNQLWPANGGISLMPPETESDQNIYKSIWYRCAENRMSIYDFDAISLLGGTNNMASSNLKVGDVDANGAEISIEDIIPYVDDASSFGTPANYTDTWSQDLTFAQCLMGCMEMLHRDFPTKPIILCSVMPCRGEYGNYIYNKEGSPLNGVRLSERVAIITMRIAEYYKSIKNWNVYGVPFYWGIRTVENASAFTIWSNGRGIADGVHPNRLCAIKMVNMFKDSIFM